MTEGLCRLAGTLAAFMALPAYAGFVSVQWPSGTEQVHYPLVAEESGPGFAGLANLSTGRFAAMSYVDSGNFHAYAAFSLVQIRWVPDDGTSTFTINPGDISARVAGTLSVPLPPPMSVDGNIGMATAVLSLEGGPVPGTATFAKTLVTSGAGSSTSASYPSTSGGAQISVAVDTATALDVTLLMPGLTLGPNQVFRLSGLLQTNVTSNGGLVTVDFDDAGYQLTWLLPATLGGTLIDLNTGEPLDVEWASPVPLPAASLFMLTGLALAGAGIRRRRPGPRALDQ